MNFIFRFYKKINLSKFVFSSFPFFSRHHVQGLISSQGFQLKILFIFFISALFFLKAHGQDNILTRFRYKLSGEVICKNSNPSFVYGRGSRSERIIFFEDKNDNEKLLMYCFGSVEIDFINSKGLSFGENRAKKILTINGKKP